MSTVPEGFDNLIPVKPWNAIAIKPVMMKVIPIPFKAGTTSDVQSFSLIAAINAIASHHPIPDPKT